jgi:Holliday junction DNA helicase RuvB subunit
MSNTEAEFVTCLCNTCSGKIEFERASFDPVAPAVVTCPHCGLETQLYISKTSVRIGGLPPLPQMPTPPIISPVSQPVTSGGSSLASQVTALESLSLEPQFTPATFQDFVGQEKVKARLELAVTAAKQRREALDHLLLVGSEGSGKRTLAHIIAGAMGANMRSTSGHTIETDGDLAGLLCNLEEGDILVVKEIHRIQSHIGQYLYPAMEQFQMDLTLFDPDSLPHPVHLNFPRFTLIGIAPSKERLNPRLLGCFPIAERLASYSVEELTYITKRFSSLLGSDIEEQAAIEIARSTDGTPRDVLKYLRRVQGYALVKAPRGKITAEIAAEALELFAPWEEASETGEIRDTTGNRTAIPSKVRREVWRRDGGKCVRCGSQEKLEFDHIIPVVKGGSNTARNIELLCEKHNRSKRDLIQ